jgi:nitrite reductase/ring-hydroxylating ferredoxin subunit
VSAFITVARVSDLAPGDILPVTVGSREMVLYRDGDKFFASQRRCLHHGADLADGLISRGFLVCVLHGWQYDCATGVLDGSPTTCLVTFAVRIQGDDVQIDPTPIRRAQVPT